MKNVIISAGGDIKVIFEILDFLMLPPKTKG
jgi:hypothetical protein